MLPPGSMGLPLIGETFQLIFDPQFAEQRFKKYGPIFKTRFLGRPLVFLVGAEAAEFLLSSHFESFSWKDGWPATFRLLLGESLFLQEGETHRRNRKLMMPAFHGPAMARYYQTMVEITERYLQEWVVKGEFAWYGELKELTFEIASQIFLGSSPGAETVQLSQLFTRLTNGLFGLGLPGAIAARNQLLAHLTHVIQARQHTPTNDALSLLIQARDENGDGLSLAEIRAQAMLLLFAGHETTTAMLTWTALELARHPAVLAQARAEQQAFNQPLKLEHLNQMPYLDQILSEVERFHPPIAGGFRRVIKPFEFQGYHVPAGWMAQYSILLTHYDPRVYTTPEQFDPDRFGPARQEAKQQPFSLIGFGGGSRICIGLAFAKLEMKIVLAQLLRNYRWELLPHQNLDPVLVPTRRPKDNCRVQFSRNSGTVR
jgi:retinoid hydroxylase